MNKKHSEREKEIDTRAYKNVSRELSQCPENSWNASSVYLVQSWQVTSL